MRNRLTATVVCIAFSASALACAAQQSDTDEPSPTHFQHRHTGTQPQPQSQTPTVSLAPRSQPATPATPPTATATPIYQPAAATPANQPPQPASVAYANGRLLIQANNSSIAAILQEAARQTGMKIEGTPPDGRVYGEYGPGPAASVIAQLLDGTHTNYAILGAQAGLKELVLTPATAASASDNAPQPQQQSNNSDDDDDDDAPPKTVPLFRPANPAPRQQVQPNGMIQPQARTPQQIIQDMQMRRAQAQQNGDNGNDTPNQ